MIDKNKILESGLLELYVIGGLDQADTKVVDTALKQYPELQSEVYEIEKTFYFVANTNSIAPPAYLKNDILSKLRESLKLVSDSNTPVATSKASSYLVPFVLAAVSSMALLMAYLFSSNNFTKLEDQFNKDRIECDSLRANTTQNELLLANLSSPANKVLDVNPTENFPETKLIIHNNPEAQKNYLQLDSLPAIADDQSFQLWSLKDGQDPIPLDVFQGEDNLIEVEYVEGTNAYAITIEPLGGQQTPTLENLIGVIAVDG